MEEKENRTASDDTKDDQVMLPGFRFHPTDEELVGFYLRRKVEKKPLSIELIKQVDIYKYDPWDLPRVSTVGDKEWYFFCIRWRKYRNSVRPNRVTGSGFWKATGIDKPIYSNGEANECIGLKKSLVYYRGSAGKGTKTDWMMHEFRLPPVWKNSNQPITAKNITQEAEVWTLCRILKRNAPYKKYVPDRKQTTAKESPTDASSKTCSLDSDNSDPYRNFRDLVDQQDKKKLTLDQVQGRNQLFWNQQKSIAQTPFASYSSLWNPNDDEFFRDGNWDELGSVVELAIDPSN